MRDLFKKIGILRAIEREYIKSEVGKAQPT